MNLASRQKGAESRASFEHALELLQALVAKYPGNPDFLSCVSGSPIAR